MKDLIKFCEDAYPSKWIGGQSPTQPQQPQQSQTDAEDAEDAIAAAGEEIADNIKQNLVSRMVDGADAESAQMIQSSQA